MLLPLQEPKKRKKKEKPYLHPTLILLNIPPCLPAPLPPCLSGHSVSHQTDAFSLTHAHHTSTHIPSPKQKNVNPSNTHAAKSPKLDPEPNLNPILIHALPNPTWPHKNPSQTSNVYIAYIPNHSAMQNTHAILMLLLILSNSNYYIYPVLQPLL